MICYAGDCMDIPVTRQWFDASGPSLQLMSTMVDFGYAEVKSRQYRWTDLIGPSMRATHFWDEARVWTHLIQKQSAATMQTPARKLRASLS